LYIAATKIIKTSSYMHNTVSRRKFLVKICFLLFFTLLNDKVVNEEGDWLAPIEMESPQGSRKQNDEV
jgi:hypothetical protein